MGQAAYDMTEVRRRRAPQTQRKVPLRVEKGGKPRMNPVRAAMQHALQLLSAALLVGFAVSLLWSESQLVELNRARSPTSVWTGAASSSARSPLCGSGPTCCTTAR